jgi:hypothetical protein
MQPLYATALCNLVELPKTICNRFKQPLMETERLTLLYETSYTVMRNVLHCYAGLAFASRLWKWLANSPPIYRTVLGTVLDM